jgi:hypothetical protein
MLLRAHYRIKTSIIFLGCFLYATSVFALVPTKSDTLLTEGITYSVGLEFDSGDYGTGDTTDTWRIPVGLNYSNGTYFAGATISYIDAESTGAVIISSKTRMRTITVSPDSNVSGMGDLRLYAGYNFPSSGPENFYVSALVKLGTADENKGLGTGEDDYSLEGGMSTKMDKYKIFGSLGYQITGDSATIDYDNVFYADAGIADQRQDGRQLGIMLEFASAATPGFDDALELTGFMDAMLSNKRRLHLFVSLGLSNGSPDYGLGVNYYFGN